MGRFDARISQRGSDFSALRPALSFLFLRVVVVAALVLAAPRLIFASGEERTTDADDLSIRTDTRWAGGTIGGYLPLRVEIANKGPAHAAI